MGNILSSCMDTEGLGGSMSQVVGLPNNSYKPITNTAWVRAWLCKLHKRVHSLAAASDKTYQLLAHGRWFSPGTPASSTTKTGRHDIAEILLKVALNTKNQIKSFMVTVLYIQLEIGFFKLLLYMCKARMDDTIVGQSLKSGFHLYLSPKTALNSCTDVYYRHIIA